MLLGSELDVQIAKEQAETVNKDVQIDQLLVDWKENEQSLEFFEALQ